MSVSRRTNPHASQLRRDMTDAERTLWFALRDRRLHAYKFRRQVSIGSYIADFACSERRLIIEVDGGQHGAESDAAPSAYLAAQGFDVLRFWNNDVLGNLDGVLQVIVARLATLTPALSRQREREK